MAKVEIYTGMMCGFCAAAKRLLNQKGVDFEETDVSFSKDKREQMMRRANGRHTVPQIFIDDEHIGGCDDLYALDAAGKLDAKLGLAGSDA
ncbi:MAG: glutaredoxin 3 [Alphaproteobacteria bacterium]|nr:glutaredoxin 3 [Alphaproteobacteria bacterium]